MILMNMLVDSRVTRTQEAKMCPVSKMRAYYVHEKKTCSPHVYIEFPDEDTFYDSEPKAKGELELTGGKCFLVPLLYAVI